MHFEKFISSDRVGCITVLPHMRILAHTRMGRPIRVWDIPSDPNISKYLDPWIIYFNLAEIFGPPGTKISELFGLPWNILSPSITLFFYHWGEPA